MGTQRFDYLPDTADQYHRCAGHQRQGERIRGGGIYLAGAPVDSEITDFQCRGAKYGIIMDPCSIVSGHNISRVVIDEQGVLGEGLEIYVPTGSIQEFNFSYGTISNYALSSPSNVLGIGIAGMLSAASSHISRSLTPLLRHPP
ncbi:hypothetical protein ACIQHF_08580 [Pseudarthrobacter oxydans]|uniref:hypothetical protein n=1 Tax=Pseudarthrobacter oxydans TaxID=1671 RepID=UPI00381B2754